MQAGGRGFLAETLENYAAAKIGKRAGAGPDQIVDADHPGQFTSVATFSDQGFETRPGKTNADGPDHHYDHLTHHAVRSAAKKEHDDAGAEPEYERGMVAAFLRALASIPGREDIGESVERGEGEIADVAEAKMFLQIKEDVIAVIGRSA